MPVSAAEVGSVSRGESFFGVLTGTQVRAPSAGRKRLFPFRKFGEARHDLSFLGSGWPCLFPALDEAEREIDLPEGPWPFRRTAPPSRGSMARDKVRIRFRKAGDLRLVSHHDLMRCFERMLRRADLPFRSTEGFTPKPRLVFALSLALGVVGCQEVVELELDDEVPLEVIQARLTQQAPPGLEVLSIRRIPCKITAQVQRVCYRVPIPPDRLIPLTERVADLLATSECWVNRVRPQPRRFDLRPYLRDISVHPDGLEIELAVTPTGTARPEEVMELLGLGDVLEAGAVLQRTLLELQDEASCSPPAERSPSAGPSDRCPGTTVSDHRSPNKGNA